MPDAADTAPLLTPRRTLRALLLLDACLYLDASLRWELGLGFVRLRWLLVLLLVSALFWVFDRVVVGLELGGWLHGLLAFPLWCWAFIMASTGSPYFDWRALPIADFFRNSWLDSWLEGGGFLSAGLAVAAHVALGPGSHSVKRCDPAQLEARRQRRLAWALMLAACAAWVPAMRLRTPVPGPGDPPYVVYVDPRDPTSVKRVAVEWIRKAYGSAALGAAAWLLISVRHRAGARELG